VVVVTRRSNPDSRHFFFAFVDVELLFAVWGRALSSHLSHTVIDWVSVGGLVVEDKRQPSRTKAFPITKAAAIFEKKDDRDLSSFCS